MRNQKCRKGFELEGRAGKDGGCGRSYGQIVPQKQDFFQHNCPINDNYLQIMTYFIIFNRHRILFVPQAANTSFYGVKVDFLSLESMGNSFWNQPPVVFRGTTTFDFFKSLSRFLCMVGPFGFCGYYGLWRSILRGAQVCHAVPSRFVRPP